MEQRFSIHQRSTRRTAVVAFPTLRLEGDPGLCSALRPFLEISWLVVTGGANTRTGLRSSQVSELAPGSLEGLEESLSRAATEIGLDLSEEWV